MNKFYNSKINLINGSDANQIGRDCRLHLTSERLALLSWRNSQQYGQRCQTRSGLEIISTQVAVETSHRSWLGVDGDC